MSSDSKNRSWSAARVIIQHILPNLFTPLAVNLLSSWLRVALDPQEREKRFASRAAKAGAGSNSGGAQL